MEEVSREELCRLEPDSNFDGFYNQLRNISSDAYKRVVELKGEIPKEQLKQDYDALRVLAESLGEETRANTVQ